MSSSGALPEGLAREFYELGIPIEEYAVTTYGIIEGGIIGVFALLGSLICAVLFPILLIISITRNTDAVAVVLTGIGAVGLFIGGVTVLMRRLSQSRIASAGIPRRLGTSPEGESRAGALEGGR